MSPTDHRRPYEVRTLGQHKVLAHIKAKAPFETTHRQIASETGVPLDSIKRILSKFREEGIIDVVIIRHGIKKAWSRIMLREGRDIKQGAIAPDSPVSQTVRRNTYSLTTTGMDPMWQDAIANAQAYWPWLNGRGFGAAQIVQLQPVFVSKGITCDRFKTFLNYCEWQLANACLFDRSGKPIEEPAAWLFKSLATRQFYARPSGYVSPEEQAAIDAAVEADRLTKAYAARKNAQFQAWRASLCPRELDDLLRNKMGPEDSWLRWKWEQCGCPTPPDPIR